MSNTLHTLKPELLHVGHIRVGSNWQFDGVISPFSRLYLIADGEAWVYHNQQKFLLKPGYLYLIPSFSVSRYHCETQMEQYYLSFLDDTDSDLALVDLAPLCFETEANPLDEALWLRLLELHPGRSLTKIDPKFYDNRAELLSFNQPAAPGPDSRSVETRGILLQLISRFIRPDRPATKSRQGRLMNEFNSLLRYIHTHLHQKLTVEELARQQGLNCDYFSRQFMKVLGVRPLDYIINKRLERAQLLLVTSSIPLQEIAVRVGIEDIYYFSKLFKRRFGIAPGRYRKQQWQAGL